VPKDKLSQYIRKHLKLWMFHQNVFRHLMPFLCMQEL